MHFHYLLLYFNAIICAKIPTFLSSPFLRQLNHHFLSASYKNKFRWIGRICLSCSHAELGSALTYIPTRITGASP